MLRRHFPKPSGAPDYDERIRGAAMDLLRMGGPAAAGNEPVHAPLAWKPASYPSGYSLFRGRRKDGDPIAFYDRWWRDPEGRHTIYRADLKRLDLKLLRAMENHIRENRLDRRNHMPPGFAKKTEDILADPGAPPELRLKAKLHMSSRKGKRDYSRRQRAMQADPSPS